MPGYQLQSGFDFNGWFRLKWLSFKAWVGAENWLRLQWLTAASMPWLRCLATSYKKAYTSKASKGIIGLASMPGYELQSGFDFNGWLRLKWLSFKAWLGAAKWLRLQWLTAASMAWLRCLATSYKETYTWITGFGFKGLASKPGYELESGFSFNGCLRLQYLTKMPGYDL